MSPIPRWGVSSRVPQVHSQDEPTFHIFYFQKPHEGHLISRRLNFWRCNFCFPCSKSRIVRLEFGHSGPHKPVEPKVVIFNSFQNVNNLIVQFSKLDCTSLLVNNCWHNNDIVARVVRALLYQASWEYLLSHVAVHVVDTDLQMIYHCLQLQCCDFLSIWEVVFTEKSNWEKNGGSRADGTKQVFWMVLIERKSCNTLIDHPNMFTTQYATDTKVRNA